jgi:XRE family aerobic/anaerobic benzoate catabolism transcriptional regulator
MMRYSVAMPAALPADERREHDDDTVAFLADLGRRVRERRERKGQSRRALAAEAKVSERYLAQLETGDGNVSIALLRRLAVALGATLPELLGDDGPEQRMVRRFLAELPPHRLEDALLRMIREYGRDDAARRSRLALVGLRGAGKTTLGDALARELHFPFVELDREIEREAGVGLAELFMLYGQAGYRRLERRCLERLLDTHDRFVVAVGGGIVSEPDTYHVLLDRCYTVWIRATPDEHMGRVVAQGDLRPMEGHAEAMADLKRILVAREPLYRKADAVVDTSGADPMHSLAELRELATR